MPKYQFFTYPHNQIADFTYLDVDSPNYEIEKQSLIEQSFELDGPPVSADNQEDAVKKYSSNFSRISQEQAKASISYSFVMGLISLWKKFRKNNS
ncbi:hypothetical protein O1C66_003464 [Vibrio cholerae]|nr:hypothetical protein [Vibrio cholerae]